ncbi:putative lipoprotein [Leptospira kirschneri serovar Bulgarica str. Nikolaevo]|nr:putative lipoprotein [Leptospira kirschneri serovar Bulgarica str. Nikolaevo]
MKYTSKMFLCLSILTYACLETKLFREDSTEFDFTLVGSITFPLIF